MKRYLTLLLVVTSFICVAATTPAGPLNCGCDTMETAAVDCNYGNPAWTVCFQDCSLFYVSPHDNITLVYDDDRVNTTKWCNCDEEGECHCIIWQDCEFSSTVFLAPPAGKYWHVEDSLSNEYCVPPSTQQEPGQAIHLSVIDCANDEIIVVTEYGSQSDCDNETNPITTYSFSANCSEANVECHLRNDCDFILCYL